MNDLILAFILGILVSALVLVFREFIKEYKKYYLRKLREKFKIKV